MSPLQPQSFNVTKPHANLTLAAFLRSALPGQSWSQVRRLISSRRIKINGEPCLDSTRRLKEGERVEVCPQPAARLPRFDEITLRYLDRDIAVVEKPAGIATVRHPAERLWKDRRRVLSPTLEDLVWWQINHRFKAASSRRAAQSKAATSAELQKSKKSKAASSRRTPKLRIVQRLDKETSGLVVFARTVQAEQGLGKQFRRHTVIRKYLAIVPGQVKPQTIRSFLVRDRGDGRRGSARSAGLGKEAITHVDVVERLPGYSLLSCRLETGRTHQIRIHLAELGHPLCGERVYKRKPAEEPRNDMSGAPRLALHAAELGFVHPATGQALHWTMPLPPDLRDFLERLRS